MNRKYMMEKAQTKRIDLENVEKTNRISLKKRKNLRISNSALKDQIHENQSVDASNSKMMTLTGIGGSIGENTNWKEIIHDALSKKLG